MKPNLHSLLLLAGLAMGGILGASALSAVAQTSGWTAAPANPPSSNVSAPINVGDSIQRKLGTLYVGLAETTNAVIGAGLLAGNTAVFGSFTYNPGGSIKAGQVLTATNAYGDAEWRNAQSFEYSCISSATGQAFFGCFQLDTTTGNITVKLADNHVNGTTAANSTGINWNQKAVIEPLTLFGTTSQAPYSNLVTIGAQVGSSFPAVCIVDGTGKVGCAAAQNWQYSGWARLAKPF